MTIYNSCSRTSSTRLLLLILGAGIAAFIFLRLYLITDAQPVANCSPPYLVDEQFDNGARWQLCWEQRDWDGIVLRDLYYTPPNGTPQRVLAQGAISQVHVPYDDGYPRFHDVTDDGFGNENLNDLTPAECPEGTLLRDGTKDALCQQRLPRGHAFKGLGMAAQGEILSLFSVSTSGEYNYIPVWRFFDDGAIELLMGATGKLQRYTENAQFGWPVRASGLRGTSHIHNYYWRLDFDLGEQGDDDIVEEFNYTADNSLGTSASAAAQQRRTLGVSHFTTEMGRSIAPANLRSWRIRDGNNRDETGHGISYHLEPMRMGHRYLGPTWEPWTAHDFYVTKYKACEKYVSHNPTIGGCGNHLGAFVNGESLSDADVVLWYGVTFHHIARDEDEIYMHTHWDGFRLVPRNWLPANPAAAAVATCAVGDVNCDETQDVTDALFMLQHSVQLRSNSAQLPLPKGTLYGYACDISGEGACNEVDALLALQCTVGLSNLFCPASDNVQAADHSVPSQQPVQLTVGAVTADEQAGDEQVILTLSAPTAVGALGLVLAYDPQIIGDVACETPASGQWDGIACKVDPDVGLVRLSAVAAAGRAKVVDVGSLNFTWQDARKNGTPFHVQSLTAVAPNSVPLATTSEIGGLRERLYLPLILR